MSEALQAVNGNIKTDKWAIDGQTFDFGTLLARNQLIKNVINPILDDLFVDPIAYHVTDSRTRYRLKILLVSERELSA